MNKDVSYYYTEITTRLNGTHALFADTTPERADWSALSAVVSLYDTALNDDRAPFITAMRQILENPQQDPAIVAGAAQVAVDLNMTDLDSCLMGLAKTSADPHTLRVLQRYLAVKQMAAMSLFPPPAP